MSAPLRSVAIRTEDQVPMFPGLIIGGRGGEKTRLMAEVGFKIKDRCTGEEVKRKITFEGDSVSELKKWFSRVLQHPRTVSDIDSFADGRAGGASDD